MSHLPHPLQSIQHTALSELCREAALPLCMHLPSSDAMRQAGARETAHKGRSLVKQLLIDMRILLGTTQMCTGHVQQEDPGLRLFPVILQVLMGVLYVSLWVSLSGATIMYNKWILVFYNFPFPVTLTMWHMGFSAVLATICVKAGWVPAEKKMTSAIYLQAVLPVAVLFAGKHQLLCHPCRKSPHGPSCVWGRDCSPIQSRSAWVHSCLAVPVSASPSGMRHSYSKEHLRFWGNEWCTQYMI